MEGGRFTSPPAGGTPRRSPTSILSRDFSISASSWIGVRPSIAGGNSSRLLSASAAGASRCRCARRCCCWLWCKEEWRDVGVGPWRAARDGRRVTQERHPCSVLHTRPAARTLHSRPCRRLDAAPRTCRPGSPPRSCRTRVMLMLPPSCRQAAGATRLACCGARLRAAAEAAVPPGRCAAAAAAGDKAAPLASCAIGRLVQRGSGSRRGERQEAWCSGAVQEVQRARRVSCPGCTESTAEIVRGRGRA